MVNSKPEERSPHASPPQTANSGYVPPTPLRCLIGAVISGSIGTALYFLTASIAQTFASKPIPSGNQLAVKISIAVRTLVVGMSTLGTAIFCIAALGLVALAMQLIIQRLTKSGSSNA